MLPTLFISNGSPTLTIENNSTTDFLKALPKQFKQPKTILVISAHWVTKELRVLSNEDPFIIYDFYNFPQELYEQEYPANNDIKKVHEVISLLTKANIDVFSEETRSGYDHGVWSPLKLMYPKADIPVVQLSLPLHFSAKELMNIGEALKSLREDTLIVASGAMTHNLREINWHNEEAKPLTYTVSFRNWVVNNLKSGNTNELINYKEHEDFFKNHPTPEHFLPLFVVLGASNNCVGKSLHNVYRYGNLSMDTIIFEQ